MAVATDARPTTRPAQVRSTAVDSRYRRGPGRWLVLAAAVLVGLAVLAPFGIMLLNAFKSPQDYAANGPLALPSGLYLDGVVAFWERTRYSSRRSWPCSAHCCRCSTPTRSASAG